MTSILFNSLYSNVDNIRNQFIKPFKIVVISETWRKGNGLWMGMKVLNRRNKNGGRIAVNVDKTYLLLQLLTVTDNLLECINNWTLQGKNEKYNSQLYMYTPDPSIQVFKDFTKENNWKRFFFVCDDFNIGLLNLNKQKMSSVFLNSLWVYILKLQGRAELHLTVPP